MGGELVIEMLGADFVPWRCLHGGPLTRESIERPEPNPQVDWRAARARNVPILRAIAETYGACAVAVREGDAIVGMLRFYPAAVRAMAGSMGFCLQQPFPYGPPEDFGAVRLPPPEDLEDRTLSVHCMAVGRPGAGDDPLRRKGLGTRMAEALIEWARPRDWRAIEASAYTDLDTLYAISGAAGRTFWEKLGFRVAATGVEPELQKESDILAAMRREAETKGIPFDRLADKFTMRLEIV